MCTIKIQFVLWVAMETVRFHIAQMSFFLEDIIHLAVQSVQSEQFGSHEKSFWGARYAKLAAGVLVLPVSILSLPTLKWVV